LQTGSGKLTFRRQRELTLLKTKPQNSGDIKSLQTVAELKAARAGKFLDHYLVIFG
jgi:hypothetical protein